MPPTLRPQPLFRANPNQDLGFLARGVVNTGPGGASGGAGQVQGGQIQNFTGTAPQLDLFSALGVNPLQSTLESVGRNPPDFGPAVNIPAGLPGRGRAPIPGALPVPQLNAPPPAAAPPPATAPAAPGPASAPFSNAPIGVGTPQSLGLVPPSPAAAAQANKLAGIRGRPQTSGFDPRDHPTLTPEQLDAIRSAYGQSASAGPFTGAEAWKNQMQSFNPEARDSSGMTLEDRRRAATARAAAPAPTGPRPGSTSPFGAPNTPGGSPARATLPGAGEGGGMNAAQISFLRGEGGGLAGESTQDTLQRLRDQGGDTGSVLSALAQNPDPNAPTSKLAGSTATDLDTIIPPTGSQDPNDPANLDPNFIRDVVPPRTDDPFGKGVQNTDRAANNTPGALLPQLRDSMPEGTVPTDTRANQPVNLVAYQAYLKSIKASSFAEVPGFRQQLRPNEFAVFLKTGVMPKGEWKGRKFNKVLTFDQWFAAFSPQTGAIPNNDPAQQPDAAGDLPGIAGNDPGTQPPEPGQPPPQNNNIPPPIQGFDPNFSNVEPDPNDSRAGAENAAKFNELMKAILAQNPNFLRDLDSAQGLNTSAGILNALGGPVFQGDPFGIGKGSPALGAALNIQLSEALNQGGRSAEAETLLRGIRDRLSGSSANALNENTLLRAMDLQQQLPGLEGQLQREALERSASSREADFQQARDAGAFTGAGSGSDLFAQLSNLANQRQAQELRGARDEFQQRQLQTIGFGSEVAGRGAGITRQLEGDPTAQLINLLRQISNPALGAFSETLADTAAISQGADARNRGGGFFSSNLGQGVQLGASVLPGILSLLGPGGTAAGVAANGALQTLR